MKAWTIVAYTYEAAFHCLDCARLRFGDNFDSRAQLPSDREGNEIHPVFASNDDWQDEHCDDCHVALGE